MQSQSPPASESPETPATLPLSGGPPYCHRVHSRPCFPSLHLEPCAMALLLCMALAQGVRLHPSQVKPIQDLLNAVDMLRFAKASDMECSMFIYLPYKFNIECNNEGYPTTLEIHEHVLTTLPDSISALRKLTRLHTRHVTIGGTLPAGLGKLPQLKELGMAWCALVGSIPSELGELSALTWMDFSVNSLQGAVPESLGNLISLKYLFLGNNKLVGPIPKTFQNLEKLKLLDLSSNKLTGSIPDFLQTPTALSLEQLFLTSNYFVGAANGLCTKATDYSNNCLSARNSTCYIEPQRSARGCRAK